jgi:hypothetical protein
MPRLTFLYIIAIEIEFFLHLFVVELLFLLQPNELPLGQQATGLGRASMPLRWADYNDEPLSADRCVESPCVID